MFSNEKGHTAGLVSRRVALDLQRVSRQAVPFSTTTTSPTTATSRFICGPQPSFARSGIAQGCM